MFQVLFNQLIRNVARAPRAISDGPEVPSPVSLLQRWVFLLQQATGTPFHPFDQIRHSLRRRILDVHVDMIFTDYSFENADIFGVADLQEQVSTSELDVTFKHVITVLRDPDDVQVNAKDRVRAVSVVRHDCAIYHAAKNC